MSFTKEGVIKELNNYNYPEEKVEQFATYCCKLSLEKDSKTGKLKNEWITKKSPEQLATWFKRVAQDKGMFLDGVNITLTIRGIQYDYKAYKNKLMSIYPESILDCQLVYKEDTYHFSKKDGKVTYTHEIANPFNQKDENIIGGYCVIKNKRGEFICTLGIEDIEKHRKVAKTDSIWKQWFKEMCLKTVIKKACSLHFNDIFTNIEVIDNEANYDIENPVDIELKDKSKIDTMQTLAELRKFYNANKEKFTKNPELLKYIQKKQTEIKTRLENEKQEKELVNA